MSRKSSTRSDSAISMSSPTAASYCDNAIMRIRDLHISESAAQESINNSGRSAQRERCGFLVRRVTRMEDLRRIQRFSFSLPPPFFHFFLPSFFCYLCYSFFSLCSSFFFFFQKTSSYSTLYSDINAWNGNWLNTSGWSFRNGGRKNRSNNFTKLKLAVFGLNLN